MKILQICAAYKPAYVYGGPTMSVSMLSEQLAKAGTETEVYATTANGKTELNVTPNEAVMVDGVKVTYFPRVTKDHTHYSPALFKALRKQVAGFDLVHIHAWWNLVSLFSCAIALKRGVPVLLSPRGTLSAYSFNNKNTGIKGLIHQFWGKRLLGKCHIHVTSQREKEAIVNLIQPKSITVLPNFVKLPVRIIYPEHAVSEPFKLLFFSRIEEKKGLDILIDALPGVTVPFTLTVAGDGDKDYIDTLKLRAKKNNVSDKINWVGFKGDDKFELLHNHDLFILPSHDENFGNVVIESLSVGTAVLISGQVGLADYVQQNDLGWICKTDAGSVSGLINEIAGKQKAKLKDIKEKAPDIIYTDFNEDNLVTKYINLYYKLATA